MCEYRMFKQRLYSPCAGEYDTWGIAFYCGREMRFALEDVGCDEAMVRRLTQQLNRFDVSVCHFKDVVLDSLE